MGLPRTSSREYYLEQYEKMENMNNTDLLLESNKLNYSLDSIEENKLEENCPRKNSQASKDMNKDKQPYFSINSNSIAGIGNFYSKYEEEVESTDGNKNISNVFSKRNFIFIYFEISHFLFWQKEYLRSVYPELNLIMIIEINDDKQTQEKIIFTRSEDAGKYIPMKKKCDIKNSFYRVVQTVELFDREYPTKINISFYTFTNHKLLSICREEIFVKTTKEGEMQKYKLYQNVYMKHYNKKIGNIIFNFAYKTEELYMIDLDETKEKMLDNLYVKFF